MTEEKLVPKGFFSVAKHAGIKKEGKTDLAVIYSEVLAVAAGVFTLNDFRGAPITIARQVIKNGKLQAIVVNSGNANTSNGILGIHDAARMSVLTGRFLDISPDLVLPASTGVIGVDLPMDKIESGLSSIVLELVPFDDKAVATAIMTTDMWPKSIVRRVDPDDDNSPIIAAVAKGAGMIEPNMATMLAYIVTDAKISQEDLQAALKEAVDVSFNCLTVDSDTSTSDMVVAMANGQGGNIHPEIFKETLIEICKELAQEIARNGEGVTKLTEVKVVNAKTYESARIIAKSIANSPLVKTAIYGNDANWGRIGPAAGKCGQGIDQDIMAISIGDILIYDGGKVPFDEDEVTAYLKGEKVVITVDLNQGDESAIVWTGDLTEDYVKLNADKRT